MAATLGKSSGIPPEDCSSNPAKGAIATDIATADDELLAALHAGDYDALGSLFERHHKAVYGYLRARLLEPADAEDLCQEVFLRCFKAKATFDRPGQVRAWLIGIARNVLREYVRRSQRRREIGWTVICLELDAASPQPETNEMFEEIAVHLPGCMDALSQSARDALDMHYRSRMRLAQIGQRLRRSEGAIKLLMYRARQALKDCLSSKSVCTFDE